MSTVIFYIFWICTEAVVKNAIVYIGPSFDLLTLIKLDRKLVFMNAHCNVMKSFFHQNIHHPCMHVLSNMGDKTE